MAKKLTKGQFINFRVSDEIHTSLMQLANRKMMPISTIMRVALHEYITKVSVEMLAETPPTNGTTLTDIANPHYAHIVNAPASPKSQLSNTSVTNPLYEDIADEWI